MQCGAKRRRARHRFSLWPQLNSHTQLSLTYRNHPRITHTVLPKISASEAGVRVMSMRLLCVNGENTQFFCSKVGVCSHLCVCVLHVGDYQVITVLLASLQVSCLVAVELKFTGGPCKAIAVAIVSHGALVLSAGGFEIVIVKSLSFSGTMHLFWMVTVFPSLAHPEEECRFQFWSDKTDFITSKLSSWFSIVTICSVVVLDFLCPQWQKVHLWKWCSDEADLPQLAKKLT